MRLKCILDRLEREKPKDIQDCKAKGCIPLCLICSYYPCKDHPMHTIDDDNCEEVISNE